MHASGDWLVCHVQELISLAYQVPDMKLLACFSTLMYHKPQNAFDVDLFPNYLFVD